MEVSELLKKVRALEIRSRRLTNHLFTGEYHTAFRGQGMLFKEVREYQAGDDVRFIDWNVSARMEHTYSKVFEEERELSIYLLIDISASNLFGTFRQSKRELITEMAAVIAFSAIKNNDKAGLIFFSDKVEKYIPAKKSKEHVLYMMREMLTHKPTSANTDITKAIGYLNNVTRHKSIVFILSDFADIGYQQTLKAAARRHDIIGIQVHDKRDIELPKIGLLQLQDAETGETILLDTKSFVTQHEYNRQYKKMQQDAKENFRKAGADLIQVATGEDYIKALQEFFIRRA